MQELFVFTFEQSRSAIEIITVRLYNKHGTTRVGENGATDCMEEQRRSHRFLRPSWIWSQKGTVEEKEGMEFGEQTFR